MNMPKANLKFISILCLCLLAVAVYAVATTITFTSPTSGQILTNPDSILVNITTDDGVRTCYAYFYNVTGQAWSGVTTAAAMTNLSIYNTTYGYQNTTFRATGADGNYYAFVSCTNQLGTVLSSANRSFTLESNYAIVPNITQIESNARAINNSNISRTWSLFNVTTDVAAYEVNMVINGTVQPSTWRFTPTSTANTSWYLNYSAWNCSKLYNYSVVAKDRGADVEYSTTGGYLLSVDCTSPALENETFEMETDGTGNYSFDVESTGAEPSNCSALAKSTYLTATANDVWYAGTMKNYSATNSSRYSCYVSVTGVGMQEGEFRLEPSATELTQNYNYTINLTSAGATYGNAMGNLTYTYLAKGINFIAPVYTPDVANSMATSNADNISLKNLCYNLTNCLYISKYNNTFDNAGKGGFQTYVRSSGATGTNYNVNTSIGDGLQISVSENTGWIRQISNTSGIRNVTVGFGWNLISLGNSSITMSTIASNQQTLYNSTAFGDANLMITNKSTKALAYYDPWATKVSGYYWINYFYGVSDTMGVGYPQNVNITNDKAVWLVTNQTINSTSFYNSKYTYQRV